ncbi:MAG: diflavin oxidoreductase [Chitinophagaceae bacterium]
MLPESKLNLLNELIRQSTKEEIEWIHGYLNGMVANVNSSGSDKFKSPIQKLTILYGTETGNSKKVAMQFTITAKQKKLPVKCIAIEQYKFDDLKKEEYLLVVISTQGEGEPPETAKKFFEKINVFNEDLSNLKYSILGLGDSSYPLFCQAGIDLDLRLSQLNAQRIHLLQKCDVDYEDDAFQWFNNILSKLEGNIASVKVTVDSKLVSGNSNKSKHEKKYYNGIINKNIILNDKGSSRQIHHIEISTDENMDYEPGDSIAVVPLNKKELVDRIIEISGLDENEFFETAKAKGTLRELLTEKLNICFLLNGTVKKYASLSGHEIPDMRIDLHDLLRIYPLKNEEQFKEVIHFLTPIAPRMYSVSSTTSAEPREVHVTVFRHRFDKEQERNEGLCSHYLGEMKEGEGFRFYIHRNKSFKLPSNDKDMIMVGPSTGIGAFRAFLMERDINGADGKSWLFFGDQYFVSDFLYQTEIQQFLQTGVLSKFNVAFSRDQVERRYVQNLLEENAEEIIRWMDQGAHLYISGVKDPMSIEVEKSLVMIIKNVKHISEAAAVALLQQWKKDDRYQKDVY